MGVTGARSSVFPSRVRRPAFPSIGQGARFIQVATEDELRTALTPRDMSSLSAIAANAGRRIVITAPITLTSTLIVDSALIGTTIEAHGFVPLWCGVDAMDAVDIQAAFVTLRGLLFSSPALVGVASAPAFDRAVVASASNCRIIDCHGYGVDCLVEGAAGVDEVMVRGCSIGAGGNGTDRYGVIVDGARWRVTDCILQGAGAGAAIYGGTSSEAASISGNDCSSAGVDTSAGNGSNTIHGNTYAGTITNHASDAVGLNT